MIEELVGSRVIVTLNHTKLQDKELRPRVEILEDETISIVARVVDTDELGIWIEHADYPLPDTTIKKIRKHKAYILVRYDFITSIAFFPDMPVEKEGEAHRIGFVE